MIHANYLNCGNECVFQLTNIVLLLVSLIFCCAGDGYKQLRVGQLSTPVGALSLSVAYRTKLTISPQHSANRTATAAAAATDNSIMLKSDHFRPERDFSPKHFRK
ncbi:hypothetical protein LSTR_LSTR017251 [Laodelphax striatellus]|uniref:Uncharacterized protein n=1 Tax=Laodelphax striatellus TaxID=195883 RepID=A0A482WLZ2_LAOST|nr:hypothetical protein LSTR_LSTR017251 [Laodelphax striatellus]